MVRVAPESTINPVPTRGHNSWHIRAVVLRPVWDRTSCALVHDLRVCARLARLQTGHTIAVTSGNALPRFTGVKRLTGYRVKIQFAGCRQSSGTVAALLVAGMPAALI
jgi:hypothetical protein